MKPTETHIRKVESGGLFRSATYLLEQTQLIEKSRTEVFSFFSDAHNLERLTPTFLNFKILTAAPIAMGQGTLIDYRLKLYGVPIKWRTEIETFEPESRFTDQQLQRPMPSGTISTTLKMQKKGTLMRHRSLPCALLGFSVPSHTRALRPTLPRIFQFRNTAARGLRLIAKARFAQGQQRYHRGLLRYTLPVGGLHDHHSLFLIASLAAFLCFSTACDPARADADADGVQASLDYDDPFWAASFTDGDCDGALTEDDCDDANAGVGAIATDQDCDGALTEQDCDDSDPSLNLLDSDADGASSCEGDCDDNDAGLNTTDSDQDGFSTCAGDCDDSDPTAAKGMASREPALCTRDQDSDGWGDALASSPLDSGSDCVDSDATIYPGAASSEPSLCTRDADGDGWGDPNVGAPADAAPTVMMVTHSAPPLTSMVTATRAATGTAMTATSRSISMTTTPMGSPLVTGTATTPTMTWSCWIATATATRPATAIATIAIPTWS